MKVAFTKKSSNAKTGPIPVTTSPRDTCPTSCPFIDGNGCYAEAGYYTRLHWDKVSAGERGISWEAFTSAIIMLENGQVWRHNIAGDLPHVDGIVDFPMVNQLADSASHTRGFTYTHHDLSIPVNRVTIRTLNQSGGFTVNLSANNLQHADELSDYGIGPVTVVVDSKQTSNTTTPAGRKVVICPATIREDVTCASCKLCAIADRKSIIGFPAHGSQKRKAEVVISI